ncbi:MAG: alpha/beta fold hydrolase [Pseudomonadota bacterium]
MNSYTVIFSHGQESGPWGTKIRAMADTVRLRGHTADSIDYQGIKDPDRRVEKLIAASADMEGPIVLVGSSMGGYVATAAAEAVRAQGLFVLAPAFHMEDHGLKTPAAPAIPMSIVHGWHDDVVPVDNSIRFARGSSASLHIVDGDHRLTTNIETINGLLVQFIDGLA